MGTNNRRTALLFVVLLLISIKTFGYSAYVGESIYISAPPCQGIIDAAAWYSTSSSSDLSVSGDATGCTISINSYFDGEERIACQYAFRYFVGSTIKYGKNTTYYNISCRKSVVKMDKNELTIKIGQEATLSYTNSSGYDLPYCTWKTSDWNIANMDGETCIAGEKKITVFGRSIGQCEITLYANTGYENPKCIVNVIANPPKAINIKKQEISVQEGKRASINYSLVPSDAYAAITWSSSNESVAKVTGGIVTGISEGRATITARTDNGLTTSCIVIVTPLPKSISLENKTIVQGYCVKLVPLTYPSNAISTYKWEIENNHIAKIDANGVVKALAPGQTTAKATTPNSLTATCTIKVVTADEGMDYRNIGNRISLLHKFIGTVLSNLK